MFYFSPCYVAIVDTNGHLLDSLILEHIKLRTLTQQRVNQLQHTDLAAAKAQQIRKSDDLERFQRLVRQHLPGAVIFEPYNTSCLDFKVELEQAIKLGMLEFILIIYFQRLLMLLLSLPIPP